MRRNWRLFRRKGLVFSARRPHPAGSFGYQCVGANKTVIANCDAVRYRGIHRRETVLPIVTTPEILAQEVSQQLSPIDEWCPIMAPLQTTLFLAHPWMDMRGSDEAVVAVSTVGGQAGVWMDIGCRGASRRASALLARKSIHAR